MVVRSDANGIAVTVVVFALMLYRHRCYVSLTALILIVETDTVLEWNDWVLCAQKEKIKSLFFRFVSKNFREIPKSKQFRTCIYCLNAALITSDDSAEV